MDFSCPNCGENLKYKFLRVERNNGAILNGRYAYRVCPTCGCKLEFDPDPLEKSNEIYLRLIFVAIIILVMLVIISESIVLKFVYGGLAVIIVACIACVITRKSYAVRKRYRVAK